LEWFVNGKPKSNRLFMGILTLSLGIHAAVFLHISGVYRSHALTFIELTLQDIPQPAQRNIPRPRPRLKQQPEPLNPSRTVLKTPTLPSVQPLRIEPVNSTLSDRLMERIEAAAVPQVPGAVISGTGAGATGAGVGEADTSSFDHYKTSDSYLQMVRLRIERHKQYPQQARAAFREGRVVLSFTITTDGGVQSLEVRKSSNTKVLDEAALQAVRSAAPFPAPPRHLFKGDIPLELAIVFELM
jgi:protein TonB